MYKVYCCIKSKRKKIVSNEVYATKEKAQKFVLDSMERQYELCCQGWGLCDYEVKKMNDGTTFIVTYKPCLTLFKDLAVEYQILEYKGLKQQWGN